MLRTSEFRVMNIFFLHIDPRTNASYYCDKHVVKIILEITQMLWTAFGTQTVELPEGIKRYKSTHKNHPMVMWVGSTRGNFMYTVDLGRALCAEYTERYNKTHACEKILYFMKLNPPREFEVRTSPKAVYATTSNFPSTLTPVPLCMDEKYHRKDLIEAYRTYYRQGKTDITTWKYTTRPFWMNE